MRKSLFFSSKIAALRFFFLFFLAAISIKETAAQISSTGRTFYMSFMEMEARTGGFPDSLLLYVTTEKTTTAVLDNPRVAGTTQNLTIVAGRVNRFALDPGFYYPVGSEFSGTDLNSRRSVRLVAKDPVNVYCMNLEQNRSDGTFVMPYESIPKAPEFYVTAYTPTQTATGGRFQPSQFTVVGMDNNVQVEITPTTRTVGGRAAGTPFTVTLSRGQVYQVQSNLSDGNASNGQSLTGDLTGTRIRVINGCGKINVFCGMKSVRIPNSSCGPAVDHLYTQLFPTSVLGRRHVVMPFRDQTKGYVVKVVAVKPNTRISVDGTYIGSTRGPGTYYYLDVTTSVARCITADSPVYVVQYMKNGGTCAGTSGNIGDPAILIMPDQSQKLLKTVVGTSTTNNMNRHYVNILVRSSAKSLVKLNGSFIAPGNFTDVSCAGHSYAQMTVANPSTNTIECDSGMIVVVYGVGQYESYSYCSGALFENLDYDFKIDRASKCPNYPVDITASWPKSANPIGIIWDFGDGTPRDTGRKVKHSFLKTGAFYVTMRAIVKVACGSNDTFVRSKIIDILPGPTLSFPDTINKCGNVKINEVLDGGNSPKFLYRWQNNSTNRFFTATSTGKYWVRVTDTSTNCIASDTVVISRSADIDVNIKYDTAQRCFNNNFFSLSDSTNYNGDSKKNILWRLANPYKVADTTRSFDSRFRKKFDTTGSYYLEYIVFSKKGCSDTFKTFLNVYGMPTAKLWSQKTYYCQNELTNLVDSSTGEGAVGKTFWNYDNGKKDTVTNRLGRNIYSAFDTFRVNMITQTQFGCRDTLDSAFIVHPTPVAKMTSKTNNLCFKQNSFDFDDNSNSIAYGTVNRLWIYDKKTTVGSKTLSGIKFSDTGWFTVTRIDTSNLGCIDSVKTKVYVAPEPRTRISVLDSSLCFKSHFFNLDASGTIGKGNSIASRKWAFSDGTSSTSKTINKKTFSSWGLYTTKLVEVSDKGCKDSISRILAVFVSPQAPFNVNDSVQCFKGNSFAFTPKNTLSIPGITVKYDWDFGDLTSSTIEKPVISYADTGTYLVRFIVSTNQACADTARRRMRVNANPKASFTATPDSICLGKSKIDFTNTTAFNGTINSAWTLGDGTKATTRNVSQKDYTTAGTYIVKLLVSSTFGCKDSTLRNVRIFPIPQASFTVNKDIQCLNGNSFVFTDATNTNGATGLSYNWTLTPGTSTAGKVLPAQTFSDTGTYDMKLDVISDKGCGSSFNKSVYVAESPVVSTLGDPDACVGETISFSSNVTLNKGSITSYSWNFGDGTTSTNANPTKTYNTAGNYNAILTVTSNNGCTGTSSGSAVVIYAKPVAAFSSEYLLSRGMETDWKFGFTGSNSVSWNWLFEDGQTDNGAGPIFKTFNDTGNFKVKLIVVSPDFCVDSITRNIFLKPELLFWLPTSFSPNNDGLNETFGPNMTFGLSKYNMKIFDRWGGQVFTTNDPTKGWNGKDLSGDELPEGVYAYSISFRYIDGKLFVYRGTVTILR
jgi:gliding motility-associated-like protein